MRQKQRVFSLFLLSPSSRRAWIEIYNYQYTAAIDAEVALLTEGVDRNGNEQTERTISTGRPPHGGRG